ncbi:hypothetical protein BH10ACI2_BH10ACI2_11510 [soil metagenome]
MRSLCYIPYVIFLYGALLVGCTSRQVYTPAERDQQPQIASININVATVEELEKLPHVGRKTAEAIIQFRSENGPFRKPEHLMQIRGISESRFAEISPFIRTE